VTSISTHQCHITLTLTSVARTPAIMVSFPDKLDCNFFICGPGDGFLTFILSCNTQILCSMRIAQEVMSYVLSWTITKLGMWDLGAKNCQLLTLMYKFVNLTDKWQLKKESEWMFYRQCAVIEVSVDEKEMVEDPSDTRSVCQVSVLIILWTNLKCSTLLRHTSA
jgi:hypothetical protein